MALLIKMYLTQFSLPSNSQLSLLKNSNTIFLTIEHSNLLIKLVLIRCNSNFLTQLTYQMRTIKEKTSTSTIIYALNKNRFFKKPKFIIF